MILTRSGPIREDGGTAVLGILNVTPDSFFDGGRHTEPERAAARGVEMVGEGADAIDLGGESTRPGAVSVPAGEELRRVLPTLRRLRALVQVPISVDTYKAAVARAALDEGADIINDVSAGRFDSGMLDVVATTKVPVILMHMQGTPANMQVHPSYPHDDVVAAVVDFLRERAAAAREAGVRSDRIILDPGVGFGKTTAHNLALISRLDALVALGYPVLAGPSRKRFLGEITGSAPEDRLEGTAAAVALAVDRGAALVRVHDVAAMVRVVRVAEACRRAREPAPREGGGAAAHGGH